MFNCMTLPHNHNFFIHKYIANPSHVCVPVALVHIYNDFVLLIQLSEWEEWGECVRNCEKGVQTRKRTITVSPACEGKECEDLQVRHCLQDLCWVF